MGINIKFTAAVIVVAVVGFTASSYFFSTQPISGDWMFDKSQYIQKIDACLDSQSLGNISLNSFAKSFVTNLKHQAEAAESEEEIKEILDRLYEITSCEP
jgi:flagellar hook-associated protein FlgK